VKNKRRKWTMANIRIKKVNLQGLIEMLEFVKSSVDAKFIDLICTDDSEQDMIVIAVDDSYVNNEEEEKLKTNKLSDEDINNLINE
jgi:hypothetical protein